MYIGTNYSVAGFEFSLFLLSNEKYLINALTDDIIKQKKLRKNCMKTIYLYHNGGLSLKPNLIWLNFKICFIVIL